MAEKKKEEEEEEEEEKERDEEESESSELESESESESESEDDDDDDDDDDEEDEDEEELAKWKAMEYEVGDRVAAVASFHQTKRLPARVVHETRKKERDEKSGKMVEIKRYYCSYEGYSNRMDAWLDASKMRPLKEEDDGSNEHSSEEKEEEEAMDDRDEKKTTTTRMEKKSGEEEERVVEVSHGPDAGKQNKEEKEDEDEKRVQRRRKTGENAGASGDGTNGTTTEPHKAAEGSESRPRATSKNKTNSNSNSNKKTKSDGGNRNLVSVATVVVAEEDGIIEATSPSAKNNGTTRTTGETETVVEKAVGENNGDVTTTVLAEPQNEDVDPDAENNNNKNGTPTTGTNQKKSSVSNNKTKGGKQKEKKGTKKEAQHHQHDVAAAAIVKNAKNVDVLQLGAFEVDCWYRAPYPDEFTSDNRLFVCEFCLKYCKRRKTLVKHKKCCPLTHPPGNEIYRHPAEIEKRTITGEDGEGDREVQEIVRPELSVFEVDGARAATYCQNLCLLAKLFLDHKTLYHDCSQMLFYALCEKGEDKKYRVVGYFSKDKNGSQTGHNLACILTLPPYQRKGYGRFLIAFSYELTKREGWVGTPEKPLSDLGLMSYSAYWGDVISELLKSLEIGTVITVSKISKLTHLATQDVILVLEQAQILKRKSKATGNTSNDGQQQQATVPTETTANETDGTGNDSTNMVIGQVVEVTAETIAKLDEIVTPAARRAKALDVNVKYLRWEGTPVSNVV
jgi:histone acetyltransferase MYST1